LELNMKATLLAAAAALALGVGSAHAGPATDFILSKMPAGSVLFEDDSAESIVSLTAGDTILDEGDVLRGILRIQKVAGTALAIAPAAGVELTGVFEAKVTKKTTIPNPNPVLPPVGHFFEFGPTGTLGTSLGFGTYDPGAMIFLFADNTPDFAIGGATCTTTGAGNDCEANAINGELFAVAGFTGDKDEFWRTQLLGFDDISVLTNANEATALGQFGFNIGLLFAAFDYSQFACDPSYNAFWQGTGNRCGAAFGGDGKVDVVGSGSLLGTKDTNGNSITPYQGTDDTDFTVNRVPEPTTLSLLGLALLGAGVASRRRKVA
jgi:hypothetical protein